MSDELNTSLLTTKQVAKHIGICAHTLEVARCEGGKFAEIPYIKMGRNVRYRLADVEEFVENHLVSPSVG